VYQVMPVITTASCFTVKVGSGFTKEFEQNVNTYMHNLDIYKF